MATTKKAAVSKEAPVAKKAAAKKPVAKKEVAPVAKAVKPRWSDVKKAELDGLVWEDLEPARYYVNQLGEALNRGHLPGLEARLQRALVAVSIARQMQDARQDSASDKNAEAVLKQGREMLDSLDSNEMQSKITEHFVKNRVFDLEKGRRRKAQG